MSIRRMLNQYRVEHDMRREAYCDEEEEKEYSLLRENGEPLPEGVYYDEDLCCFYRVEGEDELSQEEKLEFLAHKQLELLSAIKGCLVFFVILAVIGIIAAFIAVSSLSEMAHELSRAFK